MGGWGEGNCLLKGNIFLEAYNTLISFLPQSNSSTKNFSSSASVAVPARAKQLVPDESGILKKELKKAYERIAALEGRNQELTLHTTGVCMQMQAPGHVLHHSEEQMCGLYHSTNMHDRILE